MSPYLGFMLSEDVVVALPVDQLALAVLRDVHTSAAGDEHNWMLAAAEGYGSRSPALFALAEAWAYLRTHQLVVRTPQSVQSSSNAISISRSGRRAIEAGSLAEAQVGQRLALDTHERLGRARSRFLAGDFEAAALGAMREVEIRVRELSGAPDSLVGVKLMRNAFGDGGALADSALDGGERVGVMDLYAGAMGTFKNPLSHREVDLADPTEASEVILLADLLLRMLDRTKERLDYVEAELRFEGQT